MDVANKKVVELGCGLSLCGLAFRALGASSVVLTNREPYALQCAMATADVNGLLDDDGDGRPRLTAALLDWNDGEERMLEATGGLADVVIGSDVLYDREGVKGLSRACLILIGRGKSTTEQRCEGGTILISDP